MGDGDAYQRTEQREDGYYADGVLDTAWLYIDCELLDRTIVYAWQARSRAQEVRIAAAEYVTEARALREKATALRREAQRYRTPTQALTPRATERR